MVWSLRRPISPRRSLTALLMQHPSLAVVHQGGQHLLLQYLPALQQATLGRKAVELIQIRKRNLFEQTKCYSCLWWKVLGSTGCGCETTAQDAEQETQSSSSVKPLSGWLTTSTVTGDCCVLLSSPLWLRMDLSVEAMEGSGWWGSCMVSFQFWPLRASWCRCTACRHFGEKLLTPATCTGDMTTPNSTGKIYDWTFLETFLVCGFKGFKWWVTFQGVRRHVCSMVNHVLSIKKFCTFLEDNIYRKYSY